MHHASHRKNGIGGADKAGIERWDDLMTESMFPGWDAQHPTSYQGKKRPNKEQHGNGKGQERERDDKDTENTVKEEVDLQCDAKINNTGAGIHPAGGYAKPRACMRTAIWGVVRARPRFSLASRPGEFGV